MHYASTYPNSANGNGGCGTPSFKSPADIGSPEASPCLSKSDTAIHGSGNSSSLILPDRSKSQFVFNYEPPTHTISPLITSENRGNLCAMSDAMNQMYLTMISGQHKFDAYMTFNDNRFYSLNERLDTYCDKVERVGSAVQGLQNEISNVNQLRVDQSHFQNLHCELEEIKSENLALRSLIENIETEQSMSFQNHDQRISNNKLDIKRAHKSNSDLTERVNVLDMKSNHLSLFIDGVPESKELSTAQVLIDRLQSDAQVTLNTSDFVSIFRLGKPRKAKSSPRQIRVKLSNEQARTKILSCRGKLKPNADASFIWINEDHPEAYKRRKIMLRELVKHINGLKGHTVSIDSGGLRLDGILYTPDQFNELPYECQPHNVQVIYTDHNTTLFAGEWAFMSNMYPCSLTYEGTRFTSSQQCFQFVRARKNKKLNKAHRIITTNDPFVCKAIGHSIHNSAEWNDQCETHMTKINRLKYVQNPHLVESLLSTGERILQEATTSSIWGIGAGIRSKSARENTATGDNLLGQILMKLRAEFADTRSDSESVHSSCHSEGQGASLDCID